MATGSLEAGGGRAEPQARAEITFLLLDGLRRSRPSGPPEAVLCALGLTREGNPHPLTLRAVPTEDERAWRALLRDLKADGIGPELLLVTADGHPALVKAIHAVYPDIPLQISIAHRLLALARKVDARWRAACLAEARQIFAAADRAAAVALFRDWHARWLKQGEPAVRSLEADLASCLAFYRFPSFLWNKIRTVNLVERVFRDARRTALPLAPAATDEWDEGVNGDEAPQADSDRGRPTRPPRVSRTDRVPLPAAEPHEWALGTSAAEGKSLPEQTRSQAPTPSAERPAEMPAAEAAAAEALIPPVAAPAEVAALPPAAPPMPSPASEEVRPVSAEIEPEAPPGHPGQETPLAEAVREPDAIVLHVSHLREAEAVVLHLPLTQDAPSADRPGPAWSQEPGHRRLELSADEAFEEWLRTYRRQILRIKVVMALASVIGLLAGVALSLGR